MKPKNKKTKDFIHQLVKDNKPVSYTSFILPTLKFIGISILYLIFWLFMYYDFRVDLNEKLLTGQFILEILTVLSLLFFLVVMIKMNLAPRKDIGFGKITILSIFLIVICLLAITTAAPSVIDSSNMLYHMHCFASMSLFTIPLSVIGFIIFKNHTSTQPGWLGFFILSYSSIIGYFAVRMTCSADAIDHQIYLHILPLIFYGILGVYLGRKLLRW